MASQRKKLDTNAMTTTAQDYKTQGNELFQQGNISEAIQAYSKGIKLAKDSQLQATLYSNRAACYLKSSSHLQECIDDCTHALDVLEGESTLIRSKILYRRAKARFLLSEEPSNNDQKDLLKFAAQDLLSLLSFDKQNKDAATLLQAIRAKATLQQGSPISNTLDDLDNDSNHACKVLLGLLTNDPSCSMELGRLGGVEKLRNLHTTLGLQVLACACSYPNFVRTFASTQISQTEIANIVDNRENAVDYQMAALSIWLRLVMYLDESDAEESRIDGASLAKTCRAALSSQDPRLMQASLEILSNWTSVGDNDDDSPFNKSEQEVRALKPRELSEYKKQQYEHSQKLKRWNNDRSLQFLQHGGLETIMHAAVQSKNHFMQREMSVVLGRMFGAIEAENDVKNVVKPLLNFHEGVTIEEVHTDFDEKDDNDDSEERQLQERAFLTISLLLGVPEVGVWALSRTGGVEELRELINSNDNESLFLASELVSAASSVEQARPLVANLPLDLLLESDDYDIRSGAASALAKLGLADKALSANEGEVMGLLQLSVELLYDDTAKEIQEDLLPNVKRSDGSAKPTTAIERGVEVLSYLASKTQVKEELAFGFRPSPESSSTALDRLVELSSAIEAGESLSAYGLATIFSLMAVSIQTLRREAFAGKEISMEQYDELQALGKTSEEKDMAPEEPLDSPASVQERIRRMASANVPRALVKLMDGATDTTVEQIINGLNRMASEPSVRGLIVQQGALSACLKVEKGENPSESGKKILRDARHCIAKLLVSTNPSLLTSSQRMGSIKPLMQLIRDHEATDLQQFEALLAITNLASADDETKERIVAERGISTLSYAMFSDHEMVQRAATEAMCNLVPHPAMMKHLADPEHLRLWLAFASDVEGNFECARAATGCLAMSSYEPEIADALVGLKSFKESMTAMLECGNLEVMHRALVVVLNLVELGGKYREAAVSAGLVAFCKAYVDSYHDGKKADELHFSAADQQQMAVTVDVAKEIVRQAEQ